jgi:hypothetical protein
VTKPKLVFLAAMATAALAARQPSVIGEAWAACDPGTKINKTTVEETSSRILKAGYAKPEHLRKGCDNTWHGTAMKDGEQVNVAVLPDGKVVQDGD